MRISDWSSDVCSSDLLGRRHRATEQGRANIFLANLANALDPGHFDPPLEDDEWCRANRPAELAGHLSVKRRSEEHTSELQSLMRTSYAFFCLTKKTCTTNE